VKRGVGSVLVRWKPSLPNELTREGYDIQVAPILEEVFGDGGSGGGGGDSGGVGKHGGEDGNGSGGGGGVGRNGSGGGSGCVGDSGICGNGSVSGSGGAAAMATTIPSAAWVSACSNVSATEYTIAGLRGGELYSLRVRAVNSRGASPWRECTFRTKIDAVEGGARGPLLPHQALLAVTPPVRSYSWSQQTNVPEVVVRVRLPEGTRGRAVAVDVKKKQLQVCYRPLPQVCRGPRTRGPRVRN
jgi:hypothetical protein